MARRRRRAQGTEGVDLAQRDNGTAGVQDALALFLLPESPRQLEAAGFDYDSTWGYNNAVGYRPGTSQVFRLPETGGADGIATFHHGLGALYPYPDEPI